MTPINPHDPRDEDRVDPDGGAMSSRIDTKVCENCGGQKCMGCVFREYDHTCRDDCPVCCDPPRCTCDAQDVPGANHVAPCIFYGAEEDARIQREAAGRLIGKLTKLEVEHASIAAERDQLKEAIASALTSLATGPAKDGYAYAVLTEALSGTDPESVPPESSHGSEETDA